MAVMYPSESRCRSEQPACPQCGQLECLCRPRFFAGQLLSEQDLNRLDRYIVEKNRLQNRHIHGWGVVCGLEVGCDPCSDMLKVSPGYALSPCGDDIVVCEPAEVPVGKLICECRDKEWEDVECRPYRERDHCRDLEEEWVLAIRYQESPSRGITALRGPGGTDSCGCGTSSSSDSVAGKPRGTPAQCEPTVTCEGFTFEVFRAPKEDDRKRLKQLFNDRQVRLPSSLFAFLCRLDGALVERICCCMEELMLAVAERPKPGSQATTGQALDQLTHWCCTVRASLERVITRRLGANCGLLAELRRIECGVVGDGDGLLKTYATLKQAFGRIVLRAILDCVCSALLPPCPEPAVDVRVPLATVRIRTGDCKVIGVCNWTPLRRYVLTFPMIRYWLSWLPFGRKVREGMAKLCCGDIKGERGPQKIPNEDVDHWESVPMSEEGLELVEFFDEKKMSDSRMSTWLPLMAAFSTGPQSMTYADVFDATASRKGGDEILELSDEEMFATPEFRFLSNMANSMSGGLLAEGLEGLGAVMPMAASAGYQAKKGSDDGPDIEALQTQIEALKKKVDQQEKSIKAMKSSKG